MASPCRKVKGDISRMMQFLYPAVHHQICCSHHMDLRGRAAFWGTILSKTASKFWASLVVGKRFEVQEDGDMDAAHVGIDHILTLPVI